MIRARLRRQSRPLPAAGGGQAMVEFALVLLPMLLLIFGLLDMGRLVFINNAVSEGAREGSRWGSVASRSTDSSAIETQILSVMTAVPEPKVVVTCERNGSAPFSCRTGDVLLVTVSSQVDMMIPIIGQIVGPMTVSATSRLVVHQ